MTPPVDDLKIEIKQAIVRSLRLPITAEEIGDSTPLFADGLGLDSIDVLEIALEVSRRYGFELRADDEDNLRIFSSLRALAAHIAAHRTR